MTYIVVLGATLIVSSLAMGGLLAMRAQSRNIYSLARMSAARQYAVSAVELALQEIASNKNWRTTHKNDLGGVWFSAKAIGSGTFSIKVVNPSGALDRSPTDPVVFTATGGMNSEIEQQIVQVTIVPQVTPLTCLQTALTAGGNIGFGSSTVSAMNAMVTSNGSITATGPIYAHLEAAGAVTSSQNFDGLPSSGATARTIPDPTTVFDYYIANGTPIDINTIPLGTGAHVMTNLVLSPSVNPYGTGMTNAQGIYVIDCQNQIVQIAKFRMVGTLVLLNVGPGSFLQNQVNFSSTTANYPCLMIKGDFTFKPNAIALAEAPGINYNPPGTPYPWGSANSDSDVADSYPNGLLGLVYVSGNVTTNSNPTFNNLLVNGTCSGTGSLTLNFDPNYYSNPPPGFYTMRMVPSSGTWNQLTN